MRRKYWIILGIILAILLFIAIVVLLLRKGSQQTQKARKPKNNTEEYQKIIPGVWQSGTHVFYRFYEDGTGHTWDTLDDLNEREASAFQWNISESGNLVISHQLRIRGFIPRMYLIDYIDKDSLRFHDSYSSHSLKRLDK